MQAVSDFMHQLGTRRALISLFLVTLFFGVFTAKDTFTSSTQKAQAGNCFAMDEHWKMRAGSVPLDVGRAHFGATICLGDDGTIDSVSPFLNGGIEGVGTPAGFQWDNQGAWIVKQTDTYVEVRGQAKLKECLPGLADVVCSLTTTQSFKLRYTPQYGPYVPGTEPGVWASSRFCSLTGCSSWSSTGFIRQ